MTCEQAAARLEAKAEALRKEGHYTAAHDWQRRASEMEHLASMAASLPRPPRKR